MRESAARVNNVGADRLLSVEEVAERCGLSRRAVYRAIERGELAASRLCSRLRIRSEDVEAWIAANRVESVDASRPPPATQALPAAPADGLRKLRRRS